MAHCCLLRPLCGQVGSLPKEPACFLSSCSLSTYFRTYFSGLPMFLDLPLRSSKHFISRTRAKLTDFSFSRLQVSGQTPWSMFGAATSGYIVVPPAPDLVGCFFCSASGAQSMRSMKQTHSKCQALTCRLTF